MSKIKDIEQKQMGLKAIVDLTGIFEGVASMKISKIKNQVLQATEFFEDLWGIYTQLRVDGLFRFGRSQNKVEVIQKELFIVITAEGGFSGDIDQKLITLMLSKYDKEKNEIIVIGHHGAVQLAQRGIAFKKYFKLQDNDQNINVGPIIKEVQKYKDTSVFYQQYVSLMVQDVRRIKLSKAVTDQGSRSDKPDDIISDANYIFEPSIYAVVDHLERSMLYIALSQLILDSKLAQHASRFRAMSASHQMADESLGDVTLSLNRAKRAVKDERLKEMINGIRMREVEA
ncbi:MAG: F0F1 ATP synthase subunit gamma [Patescibacteria group bacterium]